MSARAHLSHETRRARPALVIDGEATLISRTAAAHRVAPAPEPEPAEAVRFELLAQNENQAPAFGRRAAGRRHSAPDLVFQGAAPARAARRGLSVFTDRAGFGTTRQRRMTGLLAALALLALPVLILSAPFAPAEATPGTGLVVAEPLVIDQLATSIVPRGTGAVLTVEARIRNVSGRSAAVPPVRIALAEPGGGQRSKALVPAVATLPAGRSVRFHSTIAVAKDTRGAIKVGFLAPPAPSGKTFIE